MYFEHIITQLNLHKNADFFSILWYNNNRGGGSLNEKFKIDIENIKSELEIEGMQLSNEDIELLEMYSSKEINKDQLIDTIKSNVLEGLKNNARLV